MRSAPLKLVLPPEGTLTPNNGVDPLRFYYKPLVGRIFRARIDKGLALIKGRFRRLLEVGYGSGVLLPTLARLTDQLYGVDLEAVPPTLPEKLAALGVHPAALVQGDVQELPFPDGHFDGVAAFSILEHLRRPELERAVAEVARVLASGGRFLVACPAVHRVMNAAFAAIGFSGIAQHHHSSIRDVLDACSPRLREEGRATLPRVPLPTGWAPYTAVLLRKA